MAGHAVAPPSMGHAAALGRHLAQVSLEADVTQALFGVARLSVVSPRVDGKRGPKAAFVIPIAAMLVMCARGVSAVPDVDAITMPLRPVRDAEEEAHNQPVFFRGSGSCLWSITVGGKKAGQRGPGRSAPNDEEVGVEAGAGSLAESGLRTRATTVGVRERGGVVNGHDAGLWLKEKGGSVCACVSVERLAADVAG